MPRLTNPAVRNLFEGLGFRQSADDLLTGFPAAFRSKEVNPFEFLQNVSFFANLAGAFQTRMSRHFINSCFYVLTVAFPLHLKECKIYSAMTENQGRKSFLQFFFEKNSTKNSAAPSFPIPRKEKHSRGGIGTPGTQPGRFRRDFQEHSADRIQAPPISVSPS